MSREDNLRNITINQSLDNDGNSGIIAAYNTGDQINNYYISDKKPTLKADEEVAFRNAIFLSDPHIDRENIRSLKGNRVDGTCEWIKSNESYVSWRHNGPHLLWISGGPGKGKTMMSLFLTEELEQQEGVEAIFFFCGHQDDKRNSATCILRGLIYQLLRKHPPLTKYIASEIDLAEEERTRSALSSQEYLWNMFRNLIRVPDLSALYCILDGLDECTEDSLRYLVPQFVQLIASDSTFHNFRLLILSREIAGLHDVPRIRLDPDFDTQIYMDISQFVSFKVDRLAAEGLDNAIRSQIKNTLLERARNTFLWVGFVVDELSQQMDAVGILKTLDDIPPGLPAVYDRILSNIKPKHVKKCSEILRWVTLAITPLTLSELAAVTSMEATASASKEDIMRHQIAQCGPMLQISEQEVESIDRAIKQDIVTLIHQSARDHLVREHIDLNDNLRAFRILTNKTHCELSMACLRYLEGTLMKTRVVSYVDYGKAARAHPFMEYATRCWALHAQLSGKEAGKIFRSEAIIFQETSGLFKNWVRLCPYVFDWGKPCTSALEVCAYFGVLEWVKMIVLPRKLRFVPNVRSSEKTRALFWAIREEHIDVVRFLLEHGAKADRQHRGQSFIEFAVTQGNIAILQELLNHGAKSVDRALELAADKGSEPIARLILDSLGGKKSKLEEEKYNGLEIAVSKGHEALVRLFLERNAPVELHTGRTYHRYAICCITKRTTSEIVRMLLQYGANVNVSYTAPGGSSYDCPVVDAVKCRNDAVLQILLMNGANPNASDRYGIPAPNWAVRFYPSESNARQLLAYGAKSPGTLHYAIGRGNIQAAEILLSHGYKKDEVYEGWLLGGFEGTEMTPVEYGRAMGQEAAVKFLEEYVPKE